MQTLTFWILVESLKDTEKKCWKLCDLFWWLPVELKNCFPSAFTSLLVLLSNKTDVTKYANNLPYMSCCFPLIHLPMSLYTVHPPVKQKLKIKLNPSDDTIPECDSWLLKAADRNSLITWHLSEKGKAHTQLDMFSLKLDRNFREGANVSFMWGRAEDICICTCVRQKKREGGARQGMTNRVVKGTYS